MGIAERLTKIMKEAEGKAKTDQVGMMMNYEQGDLSDEDTLNLFSDLIKSGLVWKLQGHYGRTAKALMDQGYIDKTGKILKTECIKEAKTQQRKQDYEEFVNGLPIPDANLKSNGGRIPDKAKYGTWLKKNDPIAFNVGYGEWIPKHLKESKISCNKPELDVDNKKNINESIPKTHYRKRVKEIEELYKAKKISAGEAAELIGKVNEDRGPSIRNIKEYK